MKTLLTMVKRDSVLLWRNGHVLITMILMVLMILLVVLLPDSLPPRHNALILDKSSDVFLLTRLGSRLPAVITGSEAHFGEELGKRPSLIGIELTGTSSQPNVTILAGGHVPAKKLALAESLVDQLLYEAAKAGGHASLAPAEVRYLQPPSGPIPLNLRGVPVFLIFEAGILGFLLVAVFVFQEKQEGTIRAYRASPAGTLSYVSAKTVVFVGLSLLYGAGVLMAAMISGARPAVVGSLLTLAAAAATLTLIGLAFACFFANLSQWFFPGLAVLILNIAPFLGSVNPAFDPWWLRLSPSYQFLHLSEHFLFHHSSAPANPGSVLVAGLWLVAAAIFAVMAVRRKLLGEAA